MIIINTIGGSFNNAVRYPVAIFYEVNSEKFTKVYCSKAIALRMIIWI